MRDIVTAICCLAWLALACDPADAARRVAFVVGVDRYDNLPGDQQLRRAVADARAMSRTLKDLQFEVVDGENLGREAFYEAWQRFLIKLAPGDTAAVFFAGHGVEMRGSNFLMPRDVPAATKGELVLRSASIPLADMLDQLNERNPGTSLVVLDACRNNPFSVSGRSVGGARGLARVDERLGTLILYSAGIGQVALDHVPGEPSAANSVFTHTLIPLLKTPGLDLLDVARQTQRRVDALARRDSHTQTPAFYSQLLTDVYLAGAPVAAAPAPVVDPEAARKATEAEIARRVEEERKRLVAEYEAERKRLTIVARPALGERETAIGAEIDQLDKEWARRHPPPAASPAIRNGVVRLEEDLARREALRRKSAEVAGQSVPDSLDPALAAAPGSGQTFRDCYDVDPVRNRVCPELVVVPAGSFRMGSNERDNERPLQTVTIPRAFAIGKFEVTFDEWDACVAGGGCAGRTAPDDAGWGKGRRPVINVSWHDANSYVNWLSMKTGRRYRLPSEAEWEYAARGGTTTRYSWGNEIGGGNANCAGCDDRWEKRSAPVGSFRANDWGLHDMHGNVAEWTADARDGDGSRGAPADGSARTEVASRFRSVRGGSWNSTAVWSRAASRGWYEAEKSHPSVGFRVVRTIE